MKGIESRKKRYVEVVALHREDGSVAAALDRLGRRPRFKVDRILDTRRAASLKVGGTGVRFLVRIRDRDTFLFYENPRWFVEEKVRTGEAVDAKTRFSIRGWHSFPPDDRQDA